jgi:hypothetical protein
VDLSDKTIEVLMKVSIFLMFTVSLSQMAFAAEEVGMTDSRSVEQMMNESRLEKIQAESMTETLVSSGRFSNDQAARTFRSIASVHEEDVESIKEEASVLHNAPNLANK